MLLPQNTIINKINSQLHSILQTHYKKHKLNDKLNQFKNLFCINNAIAKLDHNVLKILVTFTLCSLFYVDTNFLFTNLQIVL